VSAQGIDLTGAKLGGSVVLRADFTDAVLRGADLQGADMRNANSPAPISNAST